VPILGARRCLLRSWETSTSAVGTRHRLELFLKARALLVSLICWAMAGNGRPAPSSPFPDSNRFRFIPATRQISLTESIMWWRVALPAPPPACSAVHFATGSNRTTNMFIQDFAV